MERFFRQLTFVTCSFLLRIPIWTLIWAVGKTGVFKTLFLIYPTDESECLDFCPNIKWLMKFFSGRPSPNGLIMDGWKPIGIYLMIPNSSLELMRKKNKPVIRSIINQMLWVKKLSGAESIGLAGQLGPIFETRHGFSMDHPFYSSTYGNIFSIQTAARHLVSISNKRPKDISVAILGGGLMGDLVKHNLESDGYDVSIVDIRYLRSGSTKLVNEDEANRQLSSVDFVVNLIPRGEDFIGCDIHNKIEQSAKVIDFSRPPINPDLINQEVVMGNRVQRKGMHFWMRLPGGWKRKELPACSMPSLLVSLTGMPINTIDEFRHAADEFGFCSSLVNVPSQHIRILSVESIYKGD